MTSRNKEVLLCTTRPRAKTPFHCSPKRDQGLCGLGGDLWPAGRPRPGAVRNTLLLPKLCLTTPVPCTHKTNECHVTSCGQVSRTTICLVHQRRGTHPVFVHKWASYPVGSPASRSVPGVPNLPALFVRTSTGRARLTPLIFLQQHQRIYLPGTKNETFSTRISHRSQKDKTVESYKDSDHLKHIPLPWDWWFPALQHP